MNKVKNDIMGRAYLVASFCLLFGLIVFGKVIYIQYAEGHELKEKAREETIKIEQIEAMRGNILSRNGSLLATTVPVFEVRMDVASPHISTKLFNKKRDSLALMLSRLFNDKSAQKYRQILQNARNKGNRYLLIQRNVDYGQLKQMREFPIFRRGKFKGGLIALQQNKRKMPFGMLAKRTIGYELEKENISVGLEGAFSEQLKGESGARVVRKVSGGYWIPVNYGKDIEPRNGSDVITSIDVNIQDVAENALWRQIEAHNARAGCAIVMEVETGEILAMANLSRDKNGNLGEYYNFAIAERFEPGSTFKLASMLVALEDDQIELDDTIYTAKGSYKYANRTMYDDHAFDNEFTSVRTIFQHSSNVGISRIIHRSYKDNPEKYISGIKRLSLDKAVGFEIPGEGTPYIKSTKDKSWSAVSLPWMSIGYELQLTPLQTLSLYNAVANGGKMVKPHIVKEIRKAGKTIKKYDTEVIDKSIASEETIALARELLEGVVEDGTATRTFKNSPYTLAGKTGTAQIAINGRYDKSNYNATFAGYFPADNPKYSCIVVIHRPRSGSIYASTLAVPVFRSIADRVYATDLAIHAGKKYENQENTSIPAIWSAYYPDLKEVYSELDIDCPLLPDNTKWVISRREDDSISMAERSILSYSIPDVRGMMARDAVYMLEDLGLSVNISGFGKVKNQSIPAGSSVKKGSEIKLTLAI